MQINKLKTKNHEKNEFFNLSKLDEKIRQIKHRRFGFTNHILWTDLQYVIKNTNKKKRILTYK